MATGAASTPAVALTIAGSDSSGGAGIQADLKTFTALGVYGASALTALTAQNTTGVQDVLDVPPEFVVAQLRSVTSDLDVRAIKTGMLANAAIIRAIAGVLAAIPDIPLVLDPVMVATSGDPLLAADAIATLKSDLIPRALVITPNLPEAAALLGVPAARTEDECIAQLAPLAALGAHAVLLKGGHHSGDTATDYLHVDGHTHRFTGPRIATRNTHGTGCTLSAAIAAELATGQPLLSAIENAKSFMTAAIASAAGHRLGAGHGPVDHLHAIRRGR
ncbi:MAG: bifunctional hydroxymethylpyrimidine kinase/phosphomethylpyrimidine kinase [Hyphomicrobiaceae bacterium]